MVRLLDITTKTITTQVVPMIGKVAVQVMRVDNSNIIHFLSGYKNNKSAEWSACCLLCSLISSVFIVKKQRNNTVGINVEIPCSALIENIIRIYISILEDKR